MTDDDYRRLDRAIVDSIRLLTNGPEDAIRFELIAIMTIPERGSVVDLQLKADWSSWWSLTRQERKRILRDRLDQLICDGSLEADDTFSDYEVHYRVIDILDRLTRIE